MVIFLQYIKKKVFCFLITAFAFYCDGGPVMFVVTCFLGDSGQKWKLPFRPWLLNLICIYIARKTFRQETFLKLVFPHAFNKYLINCRKIFPWLMQYSKKYGNDQKTRCSSSIVTAIPQFQNFAIPLTWLSLSKTWKMLLSLLLLFSPHNFKILSICHMEFFWVSSPT